MSRIRKARALRDAGRAGTHPRRRLGLRRGIGSPARKQWSAANRRLRCCRRACRPRVEVTSRSAFRGYSFSEACAAEVIDPTTEHPARPGPEPGRRQSRRRLSRAPWRANQRRRLLANPGRPPRPLAVGTALPPQARQEGSLRSAGAAARAEMAPEPVRTLSGSRSGRVRSRRRMSRAESLRPKNEDAPCSNLCCLFPARVPATHAGYSTWTSARRQRIALARTEFRVRMKCFRAGRSTGPILDITTHQGPV